MSIADYIIAPAPLTGNPVGVNSVDAHQKARDHHRIGRRIKDRPVVSLPDKCHIVTDI
ncbi:MAG: hypothetical protein WBQ24_16935 [Xanthobacteraceae bacterium]